VNGSSARTGARARPGGRRTTRGRSDAGRSEAGRAPVL